MDQTAEELKEARLELKAAQEEAEAEEGEETEEGEEAVEGEEGEEDEDDEEGYCEVCSYGLSPEGNQILFCDGAGCESAYHQLCLKPKLRAVPEGEWLCPKCAPAATGGSGAATAVQACEASGSAMAGGSAPPSGATSTTMTWR